MGILPSLGCCNHTGGKRRSWDVPIKLCDCRIKAFDELLRTNARAVMATERVKIRWGKKAVLFLFC